jgi:hypothetical protein
MLRGAATLALVLAASPAAAQDPPAFSFEDVDFVRQCEPNPSLGRLFALFVPSFDDDDAVFDVPVFNAVSGDVSQVLRLDDPASWHGLQLLEIRFNHGVERGPVNYTLAFADSPERVREVWNARGWHLPAVGETREVEGLEGYASVGVEGSEGLATVTCYRD